MKVLGKRVLIEQKMKEKKSGLILPDNASDSDKFDFKFKILQVGDECPEGRINIGDTPVFSQYVQFQGTKLIEKNDKGMLIHVIVPYDDIIAIDNKEEKEEETKVDIIV